MYKRQIYGKAYSSGVFAKEAHRFVVLTARKHTSRYDVDSLLLYDEGEPIAAVLKAVQGLQKEGMSVRAETEAPACLRYRYKYRLRDGMTVKEDE